MTDKWSNNLIGQQTWEVVKFSTLNVALLALIVSSVLITVQDRTLIYLDSDFSFLRL